MARKKNTKRRFFVFKYIFIAGVISGVGFFTARHVIHLFRTTDYFKIQSVVIDPSLQFINKVDLKDVFGKNIFSIDLAAVQRKLSYRYPQAAHLKLVKRFPSQLLIIAKKRVPIARAKIQGQVITLDEEGVILSINDRDDASLPNVVGVSAENSPLVLGLPLKGANLWAALKIIKHFGLEQGLAVYSIKEINIENISKIYFLLSNSVQIIIDREEIAHNIKVLGVILSQRQFEFQQVKYIDLRFKEPIIGKK